MLSNYITIFFLIVVLILFLIFFRAIEVNGGQGAYVLISLYYLLCVNVWLRSSMSVWLLQIGC